jgi:hypothetical protein
MARGGPTRTLKLSYVGDASNLNKANAEAESGLQKLGAGFAKFGKAVAVGVAAAGAGLLAFAKTSIDSAIEAEAAQKRLETILTNTGLASQEQIKALNAQAVALEKVGVASASNITVLQAQLATFDLTADTINTLTPAIVDYVIAEKGATASAGDFQSAANGLAQALQGNFGSLTRTGFVLDEVTKELITNGTEAERAAALVEVLGSTYAGFNETARETSEGQLVALRNAFDSLKETIGGALLPVFNDLVGAGSKLVDKLQELWEIHGPKIIDRFNKIRERATEIFEQFKVKLPEAIAFLVERIGPIVTAFQELFTAMRAVFDEAVRELKERKAFEGIRNELMLLDQSLIDSRDEFIKFLDIFSSGDVERSGSIFASAIQRVYMKPVEDFLKLLRLASDAYVAFQGGINRVADFFRGRDQLSGAGGDFSLSATPVLDRARTPFGSNPTNITVNVTSNGDPEHAARVIQRTLTSSNLRLGLAPTPGLAAPQ